MMTDRRGFLATIVAVLAALVLPKRDHALDNDGWVTVADDLPDSAYFDWNGKKLLRSRKVPSGMLYMSERGFARIVNLTEQ